MHLQQHITAQIPSHLNIRVQSSLYPTYKSVKPISHATRNFLEWLNTQPPGPVIVLGHSMGGLLAAEAATDPSNNPDSYPGAKPHRIVGMIAFDCPYLGMHPHVVASGIASLFAKDDEAKSGQPVVTEGDLNNAHDVKVVDEKVTDDWESYKKRADNRSPHLSPRIPSSQSSLSLSPQATPPSPGWLSRSPSPSFMDRALTYFNTHADDPLVRWARKHSDNPVGAAKRWVIERFQFGICMFDPPGLRERYANLVSWKGGLWVNYWTQTRSRPVRSDSESSSEENDNLSAMIEVADNDTALIETGITPSGPSGEMSSSSAASTALTKDELKAAQKAEKTRKKQLEKANKQRERALKKAARQAEGGDAQRMKPGRHFIVLPTGLGRVLGGSEKWEQVPIEGVEDEVAAHCGLFIPGQNLDYDGLVERVGKRILGWCEEVQRRY
ncbi:hypothetical protein HGRIS_012110 [Hohenbuehelia grisea]|uniref:AB hydrolase-1 domain-containing protein n=1 Tax=Hohenbuehelia grisea TaxID=104357 RepID=A0ABR3IRA0_9AGAR